MIFRVASIAIPFIWFGLLLGVSCIEAPLKFYAPGITLALGLGIGRLVFGVMNKVEIVLGIGLLVSFLMTQPHARFVKVAIGIVLLLLLLETVWLLPLLDIRAQAVIDGTGAPYSNMHIVYIAFDMVKFFLLLAIGVISTRNMSRALK